MPRNLRIALIVAAVPIAVVAWASTLFALDRASNGGEVLGNVSIQGVPLAGLHEDEARDLIDDVEAALASQPIRVIVEGTEFTVLPSEVGYDLDDESLLAQAMMVGREGSFGTRLRWWLGNFGGGAESTLPIQPTFDRDSLLAIVRQWEPQAIDDPPSEGGLAVADGRILPIYPEAGTGLAVEETTDLVAQQVLSIDRSPVTALTEFRIPVLTAEDIDDVVAQAEALIADPVTLAKIQPNTSVTFPTSVLAESLTSRVGGTTARPTVEVFFQIGPLVEFLDPIRELVEVPPIDAQVVIRPDDIPLILPGSPATRIEDAGLPDAVMAAANSVTRTAPLPVSEGEPAQFTTEDAEALGIRDLLYTATTFYSCCGDQKNLNRIQNIQRIAEETNGAIILPGDTFSLNDHVGKRTTEDGYGRAGAIIGPVVDCCDHPANVGGGVSQFTTTLYSAVFWAGLEDVDHTPHTLYFSRYPMVREATLGFPAPNLEFRNNTEAAVYIKTESTDESVTVKFFGDNGGIRVDGITSEPFNFTEPGEWFEPNPNIAPGDRDLVDEGRSGFTATVTRTITFPDGTKESETWSWRYHDFPMIYEVHPCELPEEHPDHKADLECPLVVPDARGRRLAAAITLMERSGLILIVGTPTIVTDPDQVGRVQSQSPGPGNLVEDGSSVTVSLGELSGG